jgi:hypothetical protein
MALQDALRFVAEARKGGELKDAIERLGDDATLEALVDLGAERRWTFTVQELRDAHGRDWAMRWFHASTHPR